MYQLVYFSDAMLNTTEEETSDILKTARSFNSDNQITGCLVHYNNKYIQILEGEKEIIEKLYTKITLDKRHLNVTKVYSEICESRDFPKWSMAFHKLSGTDICNLKEEVFIDNLVNFSYIANKSTNSARLFWMHVNDILLKKELNR